jgi:alanyl-tRNA synthetase
MGVDRLAAVLQHVNSNYEIDLFRDLIRDAAVHTGVKGIASPSLKVIADHVRACAFLIVDGVIPSNEGRGYVLRRIIRRAIRHGYQLGQVQPFFHKLVPELSRLMGDAYPELPLRQDHVVQVLRAEEERFADTLEHGMKVLEAALAGAGKSGTKVLPGETAFTLYDTFGFPLDLTQDILRPRGIAVDVDRFDREMDEARARSRASWVGSGEAATEANWFQLREEVGPSEFLGYETETAQGVILAILRGEERTTEAGAGDEVGIVVNQTPFYGESGGQVGDTGLMTADGVRFRVAETQKKAGDVFVREDLTDEQRLFGQTAAEPFNDNLAFAANALLLS